MSAVWDMVKIAVFVDPVVVLETTRCILEYFFSLQNSKQTNISCVSKIDYDLTHIGRLFLLLLGNRRWAPLLYANDDAAAAFGELIFV